MLNEEIIDCFSEKPPEKGVVSQINEVIKNTSVIEDYNIRYENTTTENILIENCKKLHKIIINDYYYGKEYERTKYPIYDKRVKKNGNYKNRTSRNK